jgi:tetratricopeptide (TPR) repeat protein
MKDLEQLVQFLDGELNEVEQKQLREELKNNPALSQKLDLIKDFDALTGDKQLSDFEDTLKEVEGEFRNRKQTSKLNLKLWMQIAATIIILISAATYFLVIKEKTSVSADSLYAAYYHKLPADYSTRSNENGNDLFINAIKLYNENKYHEAIVEFNKIIRTDPSNNAARLFLGICYSETNNFEKASGLFNDIIKQHDPIFEEHAAWYLSLCYIKTKKPELAKPLLNNLVETRSFYIGKATELLGKLK